MSFVELGINKGFFVFIAGSAWGFVAWASVCACAVMSVATSIDGA